VTSGSRVLLAGDASARPVGLERALTRAGFMVTETPPVNGDLEPDAILVTLADTTELELRSLVLGRPESPPVVVIGASTDPDLPAAALALGADDALAAPIHLPELCARLHARIRDRQCPRGTLREGAVRRSLSGLVGEGRLTLRPDEVVLALVRRLARAFDLVSCSFVALGPDGDTRAVAEVGQGPVAIDGGAGVDAADHPLITEAIRSRRAAATPDGGTTAVPAVADGRLLGVLMIQRREAHPGLSPAQLQFAESLAEAAARALETVPLETNGKGGSNGHRPATAPVDQQLDRRLQEEFERARRYSLSFSLILVDVGPRDEADEHGRTAAAERLRQELRLPDFVSRYGGGELALVLPETGADGARRSVARIREQLRGGSSNGSGDDPSFSAGIVTYPHPAVTQSDDMFALVEAALARGKAQTGERVGVAD
jgi:diguanylate cyclase (GGDEF)-like protein